MSQKAIRVIFVVSGLYDLLIGLAFLLAGKWLLESAGIPLPNHFGYLQFAALQLLIFGVMFIAISRDPIRQHQLIPYGMMLKVSYVGLVTYYWMFSECPLLFQPFAVIDLVMLLAFFWSYRHLATSAGQSADTLGRNS